MLYEESEAGESLFEKFILKGDNVIAKLLLDKGAEVRSGLDVLLFKLLSRPMTSSTTYHLFKSFRGSSMETGEWANSGEQDNRLDYTVYRGWAWSNRCGWILVITRRHRCW